MFQGYSLLFSRRRGALPLGATLACDSDWVIGVRRKSRRERKRREERAGCGRLTTKHLHLAAALVACRRGRLAPAGCCRLCPGRRRHRCPWCCGPPSLRLAWPPASSPLSSVAAAFCVVRCVVLRVVRCIVSTLSALSLVFCVVLWYNSSAVALSGRAGRRSGSLVGVLMFPSFSAVSASSGSGAFAGVPLAGAFSVRRSRRSASGWVAVVGFFSPSVAGAFAALWSARLPAVCRGCVVRSVAGAHGARFFVSVPVAALV